MLLGIKWVLLKSGLNIAQEAEVEEEVRIKAEEDELRRVFETTASLCVTNGVMTAESSMRYHRSGERCDCVGVFLLLVKV